MDMRCVAEQEGAPFSEVLRHAMMSVIGREPVHRFDFDLEIIDDPAADILELERLRTLGTQTPLIPAQAGIQGPRSVALGPRFRGDERNGFG